MYTSSLFLAKIQEPSPPYGEDWLAGERFPAEGVLRDLRRAGRVADTRRIMARYCAVRYLLLRDARAPAPLVDHARHAAELQLEAAGPDWAEGASLRRAVAGPERATAAGPGLTGDPANPAELAEPTTALLVLAAGEAEAAGHTHGAWAARRAAFAIARRSLPRRRAVELALGLAEFLDRHGESRRARLWRRRAEGIRRRS